MGPMRPNARKPVTRRTKPTWVRPPTPEGEGDSDSGEASTPAASPRLALSKLASLREDAAARVGATPRRTTEARVEARPTPRATRAATARTGPSLLDHAGANIGHIRADLTKIAILAAAMIGVIIALSLVLA